MDVCKGIPMLYCPKCFSELKRGFESIIENDGAVEDVLNKSLVDLL